MKETEPDGKETIKVELPDEYKKKLDGAISKEEFTNFTDSIRQSMQSINARYEREDQEREQARRAAEQKRVTDAQPTDEQLNELMATDPVAAVRKLMEGPNNAQSSAILQVRADNLRREIFEDQEKYPYYTGEMKNEIDKLLEAQTLTARNDRSVIEHAYLSTLGKHSRELLDGKLKSRFASPEGSRGTSGGNLGTGAATTPRVISADEKKVAQLLGFEEAEYAKMIDESGVGSV
jgi:Arc/MetJ-type ribon-helix-helix transcriptional regulator